MSSAVRGARAPRSAWTRKMRWVLGGAVVVILGTFIATGAVAWHEGYRVYAVKTGSMTPDIPVGSLLIDAPATGPYHRGDVVTIERPSDAVNPVVTHRVIAVGKAGGLRTKGDANPQPDVFVAQPGNVVGEVVAHIPNGGYVLVYLSQWTGVASLMTVALTLWLGWGLFFGSATERQSARERQARTPRLSVPRQRQAVVPVPGAPALLPPVPPPDRGVPVPAALHTGSENGTIDIPAPRGPSV